MGLSNLRSRVHFSADHGGIREGGLRWCQWGHPTQILLCQTQKRATPRFLPKYQRVLRLNIILSMFFISIYPTVSPRNVALDGSGGVVLFYSNRKQPLEQFDELRWGNRQLVYSLLVLDSYAIWTLACLCLLPTGVIFEVDDLLLSSSERAH